MAVLLGVSFVLLPGWLVEFTRQVMLYTSYTALGSPIWIITHHYLPQLGKPVEVGLSALLLLYLLGQWRHLSQAGATSGAFQWAIGLTLLVTNLVVARTATTNFVVLYIPLFLILRVVADRLPRSAWLLALFFVASTVGMWLLFLATYAGKESPTMYLPLPIGVSLLFVWIKSGVEAIPQGMAVG
jgi:hypothetical protein